MSKAPAFQFYPADWLSDMELQACKPATKGIWINLLCYMWKAPERGKLIASRDELCRLGGCTTDELIQFATDAKKHKFCDISVTVTFLKRQCNSNVTLINRRMYKETIKQVLTRERVKIYRNKKINNPKCNAKCNTKVTHPSSTSSSLISNKAISYSKEAVNNIEAASQPDLSIPKIPSEKFWEWFQESFEDKFGCQFNNIGIKTVNDGLQRHFSHIVHEYGNYNNLMLVVMKRMADIQRRKKQKFDNPDRFLIAGLFSKNGKNTGYLWEPTENEEKTANGNYAKEYLRQLDEVAASNIGLTDD